MLPEVEDVLRKAVATVVQCVDYADAAVLASVLKREPLSAMRSNLKLTRGEAVKAVRRVLDALDKANSVIKFSDCMAEALEAALELVLSVSTAMTANDAPILLGFLKGDKPVDIAKLAGLNSRQAGLGRYKSMLLRLPWVAKLREPKARRPARGIL